MDIPKGLYYTKEHEWVDIEGDAAAMGITDYAQSALGDITYVELPGVGADVEQSEKIAAIESVKAASDIFSPLSGKVAEVNDELQSDPALINQSCYEKGWIAKIKISDIGEKSNLMDAADYEKFVEGLEE